MSEWCWVWDTRSAPLSPPFFPIEHVYGCARSFYRGLLDDFYAAYNGVSASLLVAWVDAKFSLEYGAKGEFYRDLWLSQYGISRITITIGEPSIDVYRAPDLWMERLHYLGCNGDLSDPDCPCRIAGG